MTEREVRTHPLIGELQHNPTRGWLFKALDLLDDSVRGKSPSLTDEQLIARLAKHGVIITANEATKTKARLKDDR